MATVKQLVIGLLVFAVAGCSGHSKRVADPFAGGIPGGRVVADQVICDPSPTTCTRYVVLVPAGGTSKAELFQTASAIGQQQLGWIPSRHAPIPRTQGVAFDSSTPDRGGFINTAAAELELDQGSLDAGASARTGKGVLLAMQQNADSIVVRIIDNA